MAFEFLSTASHGPALPEFTTAQIKEEPMLFNCDAAAAEHLGGPITHAFIAALLRDGWATDAPIVIDTRVHMLMPGWFPCIPGWHHDDVPRTRSDGQPDYEAPAYHALHAMALVGDDICPTEFALGRCVLPDVPLGGVIYGDWHPRVEEKVRRGELSLWKAPTGEIVYFDWQTFHQGSKATGSGWRWFGRASKHTHRVATNEVRRQVQVYLDRQMDGW